MEIARVAWPAEATLRKDLAQANRPRILLVQPNEPAPDVTDIIEDWVRLPASDDDIAAREHKLNAIANRAAQPYLDDHGLLWVGTQWQSVPPVEAAITALLLKNLGGVVSREDLADAAWPGEEAARNALDVRILRLRRRIAPLGLTVRTVRSQGYLLEASAAA